ncbi:hypothetical protein C8Q74DRAFT_1037037 [Fomes fomentarius]|nr:hypothetical protein C8Q74DRAFT_1037037 [Fomes fomentarius]
MLTHPSPASPERLVTTHCTLTSIRSNNLKCILPVIVASQRTQCPDSVSVGLISATNPPSSLVPFWRPPRPDSTVPTQRLGAWTATAQTRTGSATATFVACRLCLDPLSALSLLALSLLQVRPTRSPAGHVHVRVRFAFHGLGRPCSFYAPML